MRSGFSDAFDLSKLKPTLMYHWLMSHYAYAEDEQFREEKGVIIKEISMLDGPSPEQLPADAPARHVW